MAVQYFASSVQNRSCAISAPARWEHIPNPEITLRVSCAFSRFPFYTLTKNADILALIVFWLHHLYHRAAYMEFHSDPDRNGSLSGSDHCRNRSDRRRTGNGQRELGRFHEIMSRLLFWELSHIIQKPVLYYARVGGQRPRQLAVCSVLCN